MAKIVLQVGADFSKATETVNKLKEQITSLATAFNEVKVSQKLTNQIKVLTEYNKSLAAATKQVQQETKNARKAELELERYRSKTIIQAKNELAKGEEKIARERIKNQQETEKLRIQEQKLQQEEIKTAKAQGELKDETKKTADEIEKQEEKTKGLVDTLMQFQLTARLLHTGLRTLRSAMKDVNETLADTEKRIIAIQRVLPEGSVSDSDLSNKLYDLAIEYGQSFANVSDIATNFARTGLSYVDTIEATRAALLALNVAELDTSQATEGMIAIMAQFGLSAEQLLNVVDALNKTADRFPVTTEKLMAALQRMGSSASIAGLDLEETIGVATALSKATGRSGANVGTAANALIQYASKPKALDVYAELSPEMAAIVNQYRIGAANVLDIWKGLSKEINNLTEEQADKLDVLANYFESDEGRELQSQLEDELGEIQNDITGVFATANTFRKNYFVALLQNLDVVEEAAETARNAQGYSIKENEKEMQTYERRVQALEEHWHKLANDEQGWLAFRKGLVEIGDKLLTVLEWTGNLRTAVIALGTVFGVAFAPRVISMIGNVITSIKTLIVSLNTATFSAEAFQIALQGAIAVVGLIAVGISALAGVVDKYNKEQAEQRQAAIDKWENEKKNAALLEELYDKYEKLNPTTDEYKEIEKQIVQLLGDKSTYLKEITQDTDKYREAVKELTKEQREQYLIDLELASLAQKGKYEENVKGVANQFKTLLDKSNSSFSVTNGEVYDAFGNVLSAEGRSAVLSNALSESISKYLNIEDISFAPGSDAASALKNREVLKKIAEAYEKAYIEEVNKLNFTKATEIITDEVYTDVKNILEAYDPTDLLETNVKLLVERFKTFSSLKNEVDKGKAYSYVINDLKNQYGDSYDSISKEIKDIFERIVTLSEESADKTINVYKTLSDITDKYSDISDALREIGEAEEDNNKVLEKQNALLEAQKKLTDAINKAKAEYIKNQLDDYLDGLKDEESRASKLQSIEEARAKVEEARLAVEEKRQAVKEAEYNLQKAQEELERAKNDRSVAVYNNATGMFEYQANRKSVESAQEKVRQATENVEKAVNDVDTSIQAVETAELNVQKSVDNLTSYLQDQAISDIKKAIEDGNLDEVTISKILSEWNIDENSLWAKGLTAALQKGINGATEYANNTDAVKSATTAVENATTALEELKRSQFFNAVANRFDYAKNNGTKITDKEIDDFLTLMSLMGVPESDVETARKAIKKYVDEANKNITPPVTTPQTSYNRAESYDDYLAQEYKLKPYDSGGILTGMGGIKATNEPEIVIDPELTKRILSPTSNEAFARFADSLGVIFGNPLKSGSASYRNTWNKTSNNDNRNYVINGVPIPRDAADNLTISQLVQLLDDMNLVKV